MLSSPLPCMGCGILMNLSDPARPRFTVHQYESICINEFIWIHSTQKETASARYLRRFKACFFAQDVCQGPGCYRPSFLLLTVLNAVGLASALALQARISHDQPVFDTLWERDAYYTNGIKMCKYRIMLQSHACSMQWRLKISMKLLKWMPPAPQMLSAWALKHCWAG